jgi:hypothetical protein
MLAPKYRAPHPMLYSITTTTTTTNNNNNNNNNNNIKNYITK